MRKTITIMRAMRVLVLALLSGQTVFAGGDQPVVKTLYGNLNQLKINAKDTVQDDKFFDPSFNTKLVKPYMVRNKVTLRIDENSPYFVKNDFEASVKVRIYTTDNNLHVDSSDKTFDLDYDVDSYNDKNADGYVFDGAYRVVIKIIDTTSGANWNVWNLIYLDNELQSFPVFNFSCTGDAVKSVSHAALSSNGSQDELPVSWGNIDAADQYDLEWTYIDSSALAKGLYGDTAHPTASLIFNNNTSRITITGTSYNIPLFYDGAGTLFFRVRSLQLQVGGGRTEAHWSSDTIPGLGKFVFEGHQRPLNWQSTTTFAEEGKRKSVVQYYDGSLRGRQTVTKDNTTNTTIVAETYYDYQGRPSIQVMPAPTLNTVIGYSRNFNIGLNGAYDKSDFDSLADPSLYCSALVDSMKSDSGAARYYSPRNPLISTGPSYTKFIPDAQGYPFTYTQYTQDNTGRISKQGGVGPTYQVGTNHETIYYYGNPDQRRIDGLFGTEVGDHMHYFKTMVRDANGQYSVSYTDMHGRTIATALSGSPDSAQLDKLSNNISDSITETIADASTNTVKDLVMESKKGLLVATEGTHLFSYSLTPQELQLKGCDSSLVCYDCLYNLEITITDDCNNQKLGGHAYDTLLKNFTIGSIDTSCANTNGGFNFTFSKYLLKGSYDITKKLSISKYGSDYYRDSIFLKKNTCNNLSSTISLQSLLIASQNSQCQPSCKSCTDSLGTYSAFYSRFMQKAGIANADTAANAGMALAAYQQAQADCKALCDSASEYDDILAQMLLDVTPTGQYANVDSAQDKYSIFYVDTYGLHDTTHTLAVYQKPTVYLNDAGNPDSVYDESSQSIVIPQKLSAQSFAEKFKPSWANALLPYHPEYCKLQQYQLLSASAEWDIRFGATDSYDSAMKKGYLNPAHATWAPFTKFNATGTADYDPLASYAGHNYKTDLDSIIHNFTNNTKYNITKKASVAYSMWVIATMNVKCPNGGGHCDSAYRTDDSAFNSNMCSGDLDMAWRSFRQFYLDVKRQLINQQLPAGCPGAVTTVALFAAGHQPHFSDNNELTAAAGLSLANTSSQALADAQTSMNSYYNLNCRAYVTSWLQQLQPCGYTSADTAVIIPELVQVCMEGSDLDHPYGASSVKPSSTNTYKTFEEVIDAYNSAHHITNNYCNVFGITSPKPYDQQIAYGNKPVWTKPDSCDCSRITSLYAEYQAASGGYSSFSNFMLKRYNTIISDSVLTQLRNLCTATAPTCNYLKTPISLPTSMQCSTGDVCSSCTLVDSLYKKFQSRFPGVLPSKSNSDSLQIGYNNLFASFMNSHLGYTKTAKDYLVFMDTCAINYSNKYTIYALTQAQTNFSDSVTSFYNTPHLDASGCDTTCWRLNTGGQTWNVSQPFSYFFNSGNLVSDFPIGFDEYRPICVGNGGFTFETRVKVPDSTVVPSYINGPLRVDVYGFEVSVIAIFSWYDSTIYIRVDDDQAETYYPFKQTSLTSFNNERVLKFVMVRDSCSFYLDSTLVGKVYMRHHFTNYKGHSIDPMSTYGLLDYVKMYDSTGRVTYDEEFGDCVHMAVPDYPLIPRPDYFVTDFESYFVHLFGEYFTYAQIDSIYLVNTGRHAAICSDSTYGVPVHPDTATYRSDVILCGRIDPVFPPVTLDAISNCSDSSYFAVSKGTEIYNHYVDSLQNNFDSSYRAKCLSAYKFESFTVRHLQSEYQYTLYYYDQGGNLVKTVPPAGVNANFSTSFTDSVANARALGQTKLPSHTLITQYRYNTLNQVMAQKSPDGGQGAFWYDRLGRLAISQNAKQKAVSGSETNRQYSYTLYDVLGRITEVGQLSNAGSTTMTDSISRSVSILNSWITASASNKQQITETIYDTAYTGFAGLTTKPIIQHNLRNRVSYTCFTTGNNPASYNQGSFFTYDIEGNVDTLVQDYGNGSVTATKNIMNATSNRFKQMVYRYDLVSGKVTDVGYQTHFPDQFYHHYEYDAENRLINTQTSTDSVYWETDAQYTYYKHGPLARTVLGEQQIQGIDYAYTLQGWLKGVNSSSLNAAFDMGLDGDTASSNPNKYVAADQYGFNLNYFTGDYKPVASGYTPFPGTSAKLNSNYRPLYNGNISSMAVNLGPLYPGFAEHIWEGPLLYNYNYDQLNRLTAMKAYYGLNETTNVWDTVAYTPSFHEKVTYDPNGNITKYIRNNGGYAAGTTDGTPMDSLFYNYNSGTNQLNQVRDLVSPWPAGYYYQHDQPVNNYAYDGIGNIIKDSIQSLSKIVWNVYGKITEIDHASPPSWNESKTIYYIYDASGNRIGKKITQGNNKNAIYTWYVRDASGNVMSTYTATGDSTVSLSTLTLNQEYQYMYGSGRLGMHAVFSAVNAGDNQASAYSVPWDGQYYGWRRSKKYYELSNHLGNVVITLSDSKPGVKQTSNSSLIDHYTALKLTETDFYPFGMQMQERTSSTFTANYRYGFNGKEQDDEVKGGGNQIDYGARVYDPRLGRFLSVDPIAIQYPWNSTYAYSEDEPIGHVDLDGLEKANSTSSISLMNQGWHLGIRESINEIKNFSKTIGSRQTYKDIWQNVTNFSSTAIKNPNLAINTFNNKLINAGHGISNTAQQYTTKPTMWLLTIPERTKEDNLKGFGYGLWKGVELYGITKIPEIIGEGEQNVVPEIKYKDRIFNHFTNIDGASGISGINTKVLDRLAVGESINVNQLTFGTGTNSYLANASGDNFVTDISINSTKGQLENIGVFGDKQQFAISFSEEDAFNQGVRVKGTKHDRGIYTIPKNSNLKGTYKITKLKN